MKEFYGDGPIELEEPECSNYESAIAGNDQDDSSGEFGDDFSGEFGDDFSGEFGDDFSGEFDDGSFPDDGFDLEGSGFSDFSRRRLEEQKVDYDSLTVEDC